MKKILLLISFFIFTDSFAQLVPISTVRQNNANGVPILNGQVRTVRGVVTVTNQFGIPAYIQDSTHGVAVYDANFASNVNFGDLVEVTGTIVHFRGLTEFENVTFSIISTGNSITPGVININQMNTQNCQLEQYEGKLVRINNISITGSGQFTGNTNYQISDASGNGEMRVHTNTNIVGTNIPGSSFSMIGVVGQFTGINPPHCGGYQLLPRFISDLIQQGPTITINPLESNITSTGLTISWTTVNPGDSKIRFFRSDSLFQPVVYSDSLYSAVQTTNHSFNLSGLTPGKIYYAEVSSSNAQGTSIYSPKYFSTASHPSSTGKMEVYFNKSIDPSFAMSGNEANGNVDLRSRLMQRIDSSQYSIDLCLFSFNENLLIPVKNKILDAFARGVKIRMVYDHRDGATQALVQELINAGIRVQKRPTSSGLMHNKFIIFDARNDNSFSDDWLWTGSANLSQQQISTDAQNVIFIQDQALCNTYTREFEEMWGSHNDINNPTLAKFGDQKQDNTPHIFNINGKRVECYFSPGDDVSSKIENLITTETHKSINFCIFAFTRFQISNRMKTQFNQAKLVRGVFDRGQISSNGQVYAEMTGGGSFPWNPPAPVFLSPTTSWSLHHKYMLIDPDMPSSNPVVQTGSFNYSNAGNFSNDENVIFVFDSLIANQYYQEFAARYIEVGGTIGIQQISSEVPMQYSLSQNHPNPFNPTTNIKFSLPAAQYTIMKVFDILGKEIATLVNENLQAGEYNYQFSTDDFNLSSGVYFYTLQAGSFVQTKKMLLVK